MNVLAVLSYHMTSIIVIFINSYMFATLPKQVLLQILV